VRAAAKWSHDGNTTPGSPRIAEPSLRLRVPGGEERPRSGSLAGRRRSFGVRSRGLLAVIGLVALQMAATAMQASLDRQTLSEAAALGQSRSERDRARFHAPYRLTVSKAPVDFIEVITPFRRVVLEAEARALTGDRSFGQRQAMELLGSGPPTVDVIVEMTFHPLHTFVGVPAYGMTLVARGAPPVQPRSIDRIPRHGPRVEGAPLPAPRGIPLPTDEPMLGGSMIGHFDALVLDPSGQYDVVIDDAGRELARARADLGRMR
jgi:hypothetical protein